MLFYSFFLSISYSSFFTRYIFSFFCFIFEIFAFFCFLFRAPLTVRNNGNIGPGSEHSLPPSYRARNNLLRIPRIGGISNNNGQNNSIHQTQNSNNDNNISNTANSILDSKIYQSNTNIQNIDRMFLHANSSSHDNRELTPNRSNEKLAEIGHAPDTESNVVITIDDVTKTINTNNGNNNLVTIVTITGCTTTESSTGGEMDILAHL